MCIRKHDNLEEIVASLTDRLRSLELENQALQQGIRPESIREPKAALPDKFDGTRRHFRGFINQLELVFQLQDKRLRDMRTTIIMVGFQSEEEKATFGEINQEQVSETKLRALRQGSQPCAIYAAEFRQLLPISIGTMPPFDLSSIVAESR
ncbi:hypothetical protein BASA83_013624 [Batrachochytrium salamandrivorans]|nr:hypothetical protein BASA83_013624 [Batrachochytrium salamandrivorans]